MVLLGEEEEEEESEEQKMMTSDLEPLLQPIEEENEQGILMEKEVMVQTSETATSEGHAQELPIHIDERRDHIG